MTALCRAVSLVACLLSASPLNAAQTTLGKAQGWLVATNTTGGLVVHVGCGDGRETVALRASESFLVQGLDRDPAKVAAARAYVRQRGLTGPVSIDLLRGDRLPYADNLVRLLVVEDAKGLSREEMLRVVCPEGAVWLAGQVFRKPRPAALDDWTHYLYDATNNVVSHDTAVGPADHLQWVGSPAYTRHHDHMSSFSAMVAANGRLFYLMDEGLRAEIQLPAEWYLTARDAFSGVVLWRRPIEHWQPQLWPAKSGPAQLPRRLVAVGDTVYVTLGLGEPVTALEAATGETIRTYSNTAGTEELVWSEGALFAVVNEKAPRRPWATVETYEAYADLPREVASWAWDGSPRRLVCLDANSGKPHWEATTPVAPLTLAIDAARVYFHDGVRVVALDRSTGQRQWTSEPVARAADIRSWFAPTLVVADDVVVFAGGEKIVRHKGGQDTMTALSAVTGKKLWTAEHPPSGYDSPEDVFVVDGLVWTAPTTNRRDTGTFTGRDLHTGKVQQTFPADDGNHMPHHRCHRAKATVNYFLMSRTGIEYVDPKAQHWDRNDWVRGACLYGLAPANGMLYAPPQSCACYLVARLTGLNALAPPVALPPPTAQAERERLQRGPAFDAPVAASAGVGDWPTYRHDAARSGQATTTLEATLRQAWKTSLGGRLTSPVVAGGRVFVASKDEHAVHAVAEDSGRVEWTFLAGGRVDSPPTIWNGRVLFGSADGYVYCLRADDGALVWRYRAAPIDQRILADEQIESSWPVHGSVLVLDGVVHCVAGRSMFVDGGMRYLRLDARTGNKLSETTLDDRNPDTGEPLDQDVVWPNLPVALPDVLSSDGKYVYMRSQRFDLNGRRVEVTVPKDSFDQRGEGAHLFSPTGFLDDSWWHRTYWMWGKTPVSGAGGWYQAAYRAPAGRLMVCDNSRVYAFGRRPQYFPRTTALEYHLFSAPKEPELVGLNGKPLTSPTRVVAGRRRPTPTRPVYDWSKTAPVLGRALTLAGDTLFLAGPPDVVDEEATLLQVDAEETTTALSRQRDAYTGKLGGLLAAVSRTDGAKRAAFRLDSLPVFDGMAAANGRLFLAGTDGVLTCLAGQGEALPEATDFELSDTPLTATSSPSGALALTKTHPDFDQVSNLQITKSELGWRLQTPSGGTGLALQKLDPPLTGKVTFRVKMNMLPNSKKSPSGRLPGNAFFVFGESSEDAALIKCGARNAGGACSIVQGKLQGGEAVSKQAPTEVNKVFEALVTVDLATGNVAFTAFGQTLAAQLKQPLKRVQYLGFAVQSVAAEFSAINVETE